MSKSSQSPPDLGGKIGYHAARGAKRFAKSAYVSASKVPTISAPTVENLAPSQGQSWSGYWTVVTGLTLVMLAIYLAANGQLNAWLQLFTYSAPATTQAQSPSQTLQNAAASTINTASSMTPTGMVTSALSGVMSGLSGLAGLF